jgi:hypothetical protein
MYAMKFEVGIDGNWNTVLEGKATKQK